MSRHGGVLGGGGEGDGGRGEGDGGGSKAGSEGVGSGDGAGSSMIVPIDKIPVKSARELPDNVSSPRMYMLAPPCCIHSELRTV